MTGAKADPGVYSCPLLPPLKTGGPNGAPESNHFGKVSIVLGDSLLGNHLYIIWVANMNICGIYWKQLDASYINVMIFHRG